MERKTRGEEAHQIMTDLDNMYHQGRFDEVNSMLKDMNLDNMTDQALITYLVVSRRARDKLPYRDEFYKKVKSSLIKRGRSRELPDLLNGLE